MIKMQLQMFGGGGSKSKAGNTDTRAIRVKDNDGSEIDLSDSPLEYGGKDNVLSQNQRATVEDFEARRINAKIEYGACIGSMGFIMEEKKGGKGSVRPTPGYLGASAVFSHNHPRTAGELGGTFSVDDIRSFAFYTRFKMTTMRAAAKEGTYSISKTDTFDGNGLVNYYRNVERTADENYQRKLGALVESDSLTSKSMSKCFNELLVELHNGLLAGQKKYGYTYTLERR